jgi:hypothetical protein
MPSTTLEGSGSDPLVASSVRRSACRWIARPRLLGYGVREGGTLGRSPVNSDHQTDRKPPRSLSPAVSSHTASHHWRGARHNPQHAPGLLRASASQQALCRLCTHTRSTWRHGGATVWRQSRHEESCTLAWAGCVRAGSGVHLGLLGPGWLASPIRLPLHGCQKGDRGPSQGACTLRGIWLALSVTDPLLGCCLGLWWPASGHEPGPVVVSPEGVGELVKPAPFRCREGEVVETVRGAAGVRGRGTNGGREPGAIACPRARALHGSRSETGRRWRRGPSEKSEHPNRGGRM